jgi:hypothetical protein
MNKRLEHTLMVLTWTSVFIFLVWVGAIRDKQIEDKKLESKIESNYYYLENADSLELL